MPATRRALVVGAGIAGPAAAMSLQKAGIDPVLFEAHPSDANGVGAFLTVASNGVDSLDIIGAREVLAPGFATPFIGLRSGSGKFLGRTRTGLEPPDGRASVTITRSDLYRGMHRVAAGRGIETAFDRRVVRVEEFDGGIRAHFADGSEAEGDVLIGCDGVHSTVRRLIDPGAPAPAYSGLLTTGGCVQGVPVDIEAGSYEMIVGKRAFFGSALAPDDSVWWFANLPHPAEPTRQNLEITDDDLRRRLIDAFRTDTGPALTLIKATEKPMALSPIHTLAHLPCWHRGRCVVIGDAAHAPSPTSGQGASLSIEDALVLAKCLRDLPDHETAFCSFVSQRRRRVEQIIKWAARINNNKAPSSIGATFRDLMLLAILKLTANNKVAIRQYTYHVDWQATTER
jgi:FAD-dependent urate hydroxylase